MRLRHWSLRRLLATLLATFGVLVAGLIVVATLQVHGTQVQADAENRQTASFQIADSLRQSSNDLTNMVRLHVATGEARYRDHYEEILAIRDGSAPRPRDYSSSFWDRVLAEGKGFVEYGPPESLIAQMRRAHFAKREFSALTRALETSNSLAQTELDVMDAVDGGADRQQAYQRLVDTGYLIQKGRIMGAIERFTDLVAARTARAVHDARDDNRMLVWIQIVILVLIVILGIVAMVLLSRVALRPLARLTSATRRIAAGEYGERVDIDAVADLEQVAGAFNEMAEAVETDVAARKFAEEDAVAARQAAEHANRAKTTFLAAMSHEIRTPMIGVTGMLELLAYSDLTREQRAMVATADGSARSLLQIIGDILDFSKIEADKLELSPETFDLRELVRTAADAFVHTASAKGLLLATTVEDDLAPAHVGDPLRLRQIISNLLSNAVKFTDVGGIEVTARITGRDDGTEHVLVAVTDTGVGVSAEDQARLFKEFGQGQSGAAQGQSGTGLGLVICRRLARLMGGDIEMQSTPGGGTTMELRVPLRVGDPAEIDPRTESHAGRLTGGRAKPARAVAEAEGSLLLLAEDHPVNRTVIGQQLDAIGFHVDIAIDGEEAFERFVAGNYGLVLTDLNMPRMDGYDLARSIRRFERKQGREPTPVIALSANVMQGEPRKTRDAGMDDFMAKPTTMPFLAAKLRQWLPDLTWEMPEEPAAAASGEVLTASDAVLEEFAAAVREDLAELRTAIARDHAEEARRFAHRIKGAALIVGARSLASVAQQLEDAAGDDWTRAEPLADRLDAAFAALAR